MFQFAARALAMVLLALAVVLAVLDITRSVTASALVLTPLRDTVETLLPGWLANTGASVSDAVHPMVWDPLLMSVFALPSWLACGLAALFFMWLGQARRRPLRRFSSR